MHNSLSLSLFSFGPWESRSDDGNLTYQINLCGKVPSYSAGTHCSSEAVVCMIKDNKAFSLANYSSNSLTAPTNDKLAEWWIIRNGDGCDDLDGEALNSIINLKCGKTMVCTSHKFIIYMHYSKAVCIIYSIKKRYLECSYCQENSDLQ